MKQDSYRVAFATLVLFPFTASAQQTPSPELPKVVVTGNPLASPDVSQATSVISEAELRRRANPSLGETLNGLPGISSTYFGPGASRPSIRGQEGDRIKLLSNGGSTFDVSGVSFDHAVPVSPLVLERVEVLRGPASLLYGGNAIGGVVNVIDRRVPRLQDGAKTGFQSALDASGSSADRGHSLGFSLDSKQSNFAWHVDANKRRQGEVNVPIELECERETPTSTELVIARKLCNSQSRATDFGLGASARVGKGYVGASFSQFKTFYGSAAEANVNIDMNSQRFRIEGEHPVNQAASPDTIRWLVGRTNYKHQELEGGEIATQFSNRGTDLRVELTHPSIAGGKAVTGVQAENNRLAAVGEEAFLPPSATRSVGIFSLHEFKQSWGSFSAGVRFDQVTIRADEENISEGRRRFSPVNLSLGVVAKLDQAWRFTGNVALGQRAPKDYELLANGPHIATSAYEIGDPNLSTEKYRSLDVGLGYKKGFFSAKANVYTTRFTNYIGLNAQPGVELDELPVYSYSAAPARFTGFEFEMESQIADQWLLRFQADRVVATQQSSVAGTARQALPRIAPLKLGGAVVWTVSNALQLDLGFTHSAKQTRVPEAERVTNGYTLWNMAAQWDGRVSGAQVTALLRVDNVTNRLAYSASSILTQTAPDRVPLPGRNLYLGVKLGF